MLNRAIVSIASLAFLTTHAVAASTDPSGSHVFVWVGDNAREGNDFMISIDTDPNSDTYGRIVGVAETDVKTTYAHHTEYEMPVGGLLFANDHGGNRTAIIDLNDPKHPRQVASFSSLGGFAMPHSFVRLPNGNVLAAFQYTGHGDHMEMGADSGGIVEIDNQGQLVRAVSNADPAFEGEGLLPYSLAVMPDIDRVIVTNSPMGNDFLLTSNTYQIFSLSELELLGTYRLDPGPRLNGHISPEEPRIGPDGAAYVHTLSCGVQRITKMDGSSPQAKLVYQYPGSWCGVPVIVGNFMVQAVPTINGYIVLDISDGENPVEVSRLVLGEDFAPHWMAKEEGTSRLVVTPENPKHRMYLLNLDPDTGKLEIDQTFRGPDGEVGFGFTKREWPHGWIGEGAPHGAVFSR